MIRPEPKELQKNCDRDVWSTKYNVPDKLPSKTRFGQFQLEAKAHWQLKYFTHNLINFICGIWSHELDWGET